MVILLAACEQKKADGGAAAGSSAAAAPAEMSDEQVDTAELPVEEDFEDEATEQIDEENVDDEVAKLAAEIESAE